MDFCPEGESPPPGACLSKGSNDTLTAAGCIITEFEIPLFHCAVSCNFYKTRNDCVVVVKNPLNLTQASGTEFQIFCFLLSKPESSRNN